MILSFSYFEIKNSILGVYVNQDVCIGQRYMF